MVVGSVLAGWLCGHLTGIEKSVIVQTFRFVIPEGLDETRVSDALEEAFNRCREAEMGPVWVEEAAVLNVSPTKTVTFIHGELVGSLKSCLESLSFASGRFRDGSFCWSSL